MRVLHVCNMDGMGGAAIGAYGLHRAMVDQGVDSHMLVVRKTTVDPSVRQVGGTERRARTWAQKLEKCLLKLQKSPNPVLHSLNVFPTGIHHRINKYRADIVQLHWIGVNTMSIREIGKIQAPVVWKMPDMWPFSGAEHYMMPGECKRYQEGYNRENRPIGSRGIDLDKWIWLYKKWCWRNKPIAIVGTSRWIAECARNSLLFRKNKVISINNPIDIDEFCVTDKQSSKIKFNINTKKKVILFGSWHVETDRRKGYDIFLKSLQILGKMLDKNEIILAVFGADRRPQLKYSGLSMEKSPFEEIYLGELPHGELMRDAYNAADVFVSAALLEGFGLTVAEALACGTPAVCFDTSGLRDIVDHKRNGYRARCYDPEDLANGIKWVLRQDLERISREARKKVETSFSRSGAVENYLHYYEEILASKVGVG